MILKGFSGDLEGAKAAKEIGQSIFHHISYETGRNGELLRVFQSHDSLVGFNYGISSSISSSKLIFTIQYHISILQ